MRRARPPADVLADEIRAEIAERYFGFRKLIEADKTALAEEVRWQAFIVQKRIAFDLIRIYLLLHDAARIEQFFQLTGLNDKLFYDPYLLESITIQQRVFECQHFHGFTRYRRYRNFLLECYERLVFHTEVYRKRLAKIREDLVAVNAEIHQFYEQNDMNAILGFLKTLESQEKCGCMAGGLEVGVAEGLEEKLRMEPPLPLEQLLPIFPDLPSPADMLRPLSLLAEQAYPQLPESLQSMFAETETPCKRERAPLLENGRGEV